ncbi:MAG: futalosine hydrolase [Vicinamibacterales bacterium]
MRLLVVSATSAEIAPLTEYLSQPVHTVSRTARGLEIEMLVTGVGMVATAARVSAALATGRHDAALNLGVCGSFDRNRPLGTVVHVTAESLPELGVEDGARFVPATAVGLVGMNEAPYTDGILANRTPPAWPALAALPAVTGVTVNTVHGHEPTIAALAERCHADVETMEGAAFFFACFVAGVPCAQIRAISNYVERRNRAAWKLPEAIEALNRTAVTVVGAL